MPETVPDANPPRPSASSTRPRAGQRTGGSGIVRLLHRSGHAPAARRVGSGTTAAPEQDARRSCGGVGRGRDLDWPNLSAAKPPGQEAWVGSKWLSRTQTCLRKAANVRQLITTEALSAHMRRIRKTDTRPELGVRRLVYGMGYRYRLHRRDLPGTPDLVFSARRKVIFVHGCFWHQHDCPLGSKKPSANPDYWHPKLARNVERDAQNRARLRAMGWDVLVVWECEIKGSALLAGRIRTYLEAPSPAALQSF
jgi:DNA mismatch endonuclease, patch repair protein